MLNLFAAVWLFCSSRIIHVRPPIVCFPCGTHPRLFIFSPNILPFVRPLALAICNTLVRFDPASKCVCRSTREVYRNRCRWNKAVRYPHVESLSIPFPFALVAWTRSIKYWCGQIKWNFTGHKAELNPYRRPNCQTLLNIQTANLKFLLNQFCCITDWAYLLQELVWLTRGVCWLLDFACRPLRIRVNGTGTTLAAFYQSTRRVKFDTVVIFPS